MLWWCISRHGWAPDVTCTIVAQNQTQVHVDTSQPTCTWAASFVLFFRAMLQCCTCISGLGLAPYVACTIAPQNQTQIQVNTSHHAGW